MTNEQLQTEIPDVLIGPLAALVLGFKEGNAEMQRSGTEKILALLKGVEGIVVAEFMRKAFGKVEK